MQSIFRWGSFGLGGLALSFWALPAAAEDCPQTFTDPYTTASEDEVPLMKTGQMLPGATKFCTVYRDPGMAKRRWHERGTLSGMPVRIDYYQDGLGMALGNRSKLNHPTRNNETKMRDGDSFHCSGEKFTGYIVTIVDCTVSPTATDGSAKPFEYSFRYSIEQQIEAFLNPRAFHGGTYVSPDREKPLTAEFADGRTESLYFVGGSEGMMMGLSGKTQLRESSAIKLAGLLTGETPFTIRYTGSDGTDARYEVTRADLTHANAAFGTMEQIAQLVHKGVTEKAVAEAVANRE